MYYANEESGDVIGGFTKNRISPEILEQCSSNLAPETYIPKETEWQHSRLQSLSVKNQIFPFAIF